MPNPNEPLSPAAAVETMLAESLSLALLNAVARQQMHGILASATTIMAATIILAGNPASRRGSRPPAPEAATPAAAEGQPGAAGSALPHNHPAAVEPARITGADGIGMALQFVAQSVALSVQDAADYLRNLTTVCTASIGRSLARLDSGGNAGSIEEIQQAQQIVTQATAEWNRVRTEALEFLEQLSQAARSCNASAAPSTHAIAAGVADALSLAAHNAVTSQQQTNVTMQAATTMGTATMFSVDTAAVAAPSPARQPV